MVRAPLGHLLLWAGFLFAAYASVLQLENSDAPWSTIYWLWYAIGAIVGVAGIVILKLTALEEHTDDEKTDAEFSLVRSSLDQINQVIGPLCQQPEPQLAAVLRAIDDQCAEPLAEFAEARQALVKRFGLKVYAEVMTEFASGERYVNRSWSAAADGYIDEVTASLARANRHLIKARELIRQAEAGHALMTSRDMRS